MRIAAALFTFAAVLAALSNPLARPASNTFLLEVPELKLEISENRAATIPNSFVRRLELRVLKGSQEVPPGKVIVRINGEAANTIMSTQTTESAIVCKL